MSRVFQCKKRDAIWTRVMLLIWNVYHVRMHMYYVMQGCWAGTGAAGTICSESKSVLDIKSGAVTAPRKVVSNSYQRYRTTSGMKWTNFRLSAPLDQPLLPSSSPRKRRLHSLQNSKRLSRGGRPPPPPWIRAWSSSRMGYRSYRYLHDLHPTCELSKFEVKISFEILQLSPTPISLRFATTPEPTLV